ncbi:acyltransferase [Calorimonas adulescens]|uniref:Acyltransferase n=1 Tax=Calorimonas adulescens TaxID=2606906 RepID=A0A5D8QEC7_9THEO|nr:acyltransferase [Calorimonas adulescens]TZE82529.1 acyltransferase [Calorimonas adulescens]
MRRVEIYRIEGDKNSLQHLYETVGFWKVIRNYIVISLGRRTPWFNLKSAMYRSIGMKIGKFASIAVLVMPDFLFPELIEIGENTIIGYNTTILCHEYLTNEYRLGKVKIGRNVMIGANCTIMPGVEIGDGAVVSACSLVNKDIPPGAFAGGVPVKILKNGDNHEGISQ